jgi:pimeloyl-ACP methyl ester carboxylesterase
LGGAWRIERLHDVAAEGPGQPRERTAVTKRITPARTGWRRKSARGYVGGMRSTIRALRYARSWVSGSPPAAEHEIVIDRRGEQVPATLFLPVGPRRRRGERERRERRTARGAEAGAVEPLLPLEGAGDLPGWVVLHGITRPGRQHPTLLRFARSLASTGAAVLIPEIPEWRELELAPEAAVPTIKAAILALDARPETAPGRTGVIGFSFGAPQALIAAADPELKGHLAGVAGFGGYADVERTFRFQFTGEHDWDGTRYRTRPDPYGRWVVGANYITRIPGLEDAHDVGDALRELASAAGERQIASWDPVHEPVKRAAREGVDPRRRFLFDLFAPPAEEEPDREASADYVRAMAREVARGVPLLDPRPFLDKIEVPVRLLHGRDDHLIPFTETLRLRRDFPPDADVRVWITGLFAHSQGAQLASRLHGAREGLRFLRALRDVFALVD